MSYVPRPTPIRKGTEHPPFVPYVPATPKKEQHHLPFHRSPAPAPFNNLPPQMGMFNAGLQPNQPFPPGYGPAYVPPLAPGFGHAITGDGHQWTAPMWGAPWGGDPRVWAQPFHSPPRSRSAPPPESEARPAWHSLLVPTEMLPDTLPDSECILWDVRHKKATDADGKAIPKSVLSSHAIQPSVSKLYIISPYIPWKITVANPKGITVGDILAAVYETLSIQITEPEYWLASDEAQKRMNAAYLDATHEKTGVPGRNPKEGVKRVDYLGDAVFFNGIRPVEERDDVFVQKRLASTPRKPDEVWIIEFSEPEQ